MERRGWTLLRREAAETIQMVVSFFDMVWCVPVALRGFFYVLEHGLIAVDPYFQRDVEYSVVSLAVLVPCIALLAVLWLVKLSGRITPERQKRALPLCYSLLLLAQSIRLIWFLEGQGWRFIAENGQMYPLFGLIAVAGTLIGFFPALKQLDSRRRMAAAERQAAE